MKIKAQDCPINNQYWYDVTDIATAQKGYNAKICVNLDCHRDCERMITSRGLPSYDPSGEIANSYPPRTASSYRV